MIEVTIGQPLAKQAPKNQYRFSLEVMFGDADGDATNWVDATDPAEFVPLIKMLDAYNSIGWNNQCDVEGSDDWAKLLGFSEEPSWRSDDPAAKAFHTLMNMIPGDPCCDGQMQGAPSHWWISYFDATGAEHECTFTIDGKAVDQHRS